MNQKNFAPLSTNTTCCHPKLDSGSLLNKSFNLATNTTCCHPELVSGSQMKNSAFTLIEILVVIVIVGILATVSVAQFNDYQERARFAKAVAFASQVDTVLMAETVSTGYGFPLRSDFDEGSGTVAKDSSGSGNDFIWNSSPDVSWITDTPDNSSSALTLRSEQIALGSVKNMPETEISYSLFVRMDSFSSGGTYPTFVSGNNGFLIKPDGTVRFTIPGGWIESSVDTIKLKKWHHIMGSYNGEILRLFVDGNLISENSVTLSNPLNVTTSMYDLWIGYKTPNQEFNGSIDRVRIYPVGLNPDNL